MPTDPWFYVTATVALLIVGIAKGGLGGGIGIVGVPLMSLVIDPIRAAAIMLPILLVMDGFAVHAWWQRWDVRNLRTMIPGAVLGTLLGFATFRMLSPDAMRLLVGALALAISFSWFAARGLPQPKPSSLGRGTFWSTLSGFTSFSIHAGGPPAQVYLLSQQLDKSTFQATTVAFFFFVNALKLPFYAWLDQLDFANLSTSLVLAPLAPLGIRLGHVLHHRIDERVFYRIVYASLIVIGGKLVYDGLA
jgi:uncharacterized membrane protein YfcA